MLQRQLRYSSSWAVYVTDPSATRTLCTEYLSNLESSIFGLPMLWNDGYERPLGASKPPLRNPYTVFYSSLPCGVRALRGEAAARAVCGGR